MVDVSSQNNSVSINVSSSGNSASINATPDTALYYSEKSREWAISDRIVDSKDYSSKYYANKANQSANNAQGFENATRETYNAFLDSSVNANNTLAATRDEALTAINDRFEEGIGDGINQITVLVNDSITEYTEIANQIKQDNSESSELAKDWAISEVIVDNIDYSAKYWAGKAKDNSGIFYDEISDEDIDVEIISGGYVTKSDLELGLDTKQDKGDYATRDELPTQVSELENDSNYATQTQVMQAIASIPQFKLSIVEALPTIGEKMTLYLVPKEGTNNDVYDEYIWIEQTSSFEHLGTTAVDLTDYVKKTNYAGIDKAGLIMASSAFGTACGSSGYLTSQEYTLSTYGSRLQVKGFVSKGTLENVKNDLIKRAVTENDIELTDDEKTTACSWLGTAKTVSLTEADYNALETKDANTLYLIEE